MASICDTYKLPRKVKVNLMLPPPYCRKAEENDGTDKMEKTCVKLELSDPSKILHLCETLTDDNTRALEVKINKYFLRETDSEIVFFINLRKGSGEAVVNVVGTEKLETAIRTNVGAELFDSFFKNKNEAGATPDIHPDLQAVIKKVVTEKHFKVTIVPIIPQCNKGTDEKCSPNKKSVPMLICFINPQRDNQFLVKFVKETFRFCYTIFKNTMGSEEEARVKEQCQALLGVARRLFSNLTDLNDLLKEIMMEARRLTNSERCSLFLLDPDHMHLVAKVFDGVAGSEVRIAKNQGIAGHVATTGKILNIRNAYEHPLFYKGVDELTGFRTKNILCFPIKDESGIVGVAQLCNKKEGNFEYFDEEIAMAFSIYCGLSIMHSLLYKKIKDAQARTKLSNELMMYHMRVSKSDVSQVLLCKNVHEHEHFEKLSFNPRILPVDDTICYVLKMFDNLNFMRKFEIRREVLTNFLLYIQRGYREPKDAPYHNWMHAFTAAHFAYVAIRQFKLIERGYITDLEAMTYVVASLCHDVDHRGTTNSFQMSTESVLASLYSSEGSVMERHHLAQTLCTINTEGCNFLENLNQKEYVLCLDILKDLILATDLGHHLKLIPRQQYMAKKGYDRFSKEHRYLFLCVLMTCADLSDQSKEWKNTKNVALLVYSEFFKQGDMEKNMGRTPAEMMDRERACIPDLQIQFINTICMPLYIIVDKLLPEGKELLENIKRNLQCWEVSRPVFERGREEGKTTMEILASDELEQEVEAAMKTGAETEEIENQEEDGPATEEAEETDIQNVSEAGESTTKDTKESRTGTFDSTIKDMSANESKIDSREEVLEAASKDMEQENENGEREAQAGNENQNT